MKPQQFHLHDSRGGAALAVRITPRSAKNEIVEVMSDGTLRIRLAVSKSDESANPVLIHFLAQILEIDPSQIEVVAGLSGKDKLVSILNMDAPSLHRKILASL